MKTIAISIDAETLEGIDRIAASAHRPSRDRHRPNRSEIVRAALSEYVLRHERQRQEARDRRALAGQHDRLRKQLAALVADQAKL
jgi:metal-responsive CopG/Arc/MetJ family transcriptional regulator